MDVARGRGVAEGRRPILNSRISSEMKRPAFKAVVTGKERTTGEMGMIHGTGTDREREKAAVPTSLVCFSALTISIHLLKY